MASAIRLCYGPQPTNQPRLAAGGMGVASGPSRVHLSLSQPFHFLSNCPKSQQVACPIRRVNCTIKNSSLDSKNGDNENKIVRGMTGISIVLSCVLGVFGLKSVMNSKPPTAYALILKGSPPSHEPSQPAQPDRYIGGEAALDTLVKMIKSPPSPDAPQLPHMPSVKDIEDWKISLMALSKSGKSQSQVALKKLKGEYDKWKDMPEAERFLNLALVELLILQGDYKEAKKWLDRLIDRVIESEIDIDDSRSKKKVSKKDKISILQKLDTPFLLLKAEIFLYKAIIHAMLDSKEASKWGEAFRRTLG